MAEPLVKTMRIPKNSRVMMMGSSQYFFRVLMKPQRSFKKSIVVFSQVEYGSFIIAVFSSSQVPDF